MSKRVCFIHNPADALIVGSIGDPGERQFFIQVFSASGINTVALGKAQLEALVERFEELLRELKRQKLASMEVLSKNPEVESAELQYPVEEDFQAGIMGITWEPDIERISLEIQEISDQEEFADLVQVETDTSEFEFPPDILQAIIEIAQVRAFLKSARKVIDSGRDSCPFCGLPIDLTGHLCPRANGYKR